MNLRNLAPFSLAVLVLLAACGKEGPAGPAGVGLDPSKVHCITSRAGNNTQVSNTWTIVQTGGYGTTPLSGDCYLLAAPGVSEFFYVSDSSPVAWGNTLADAGWTCTFSPATGAPTTVASADFPGRTEFCFVGP